MSTREQIVAKVQIVFEDLSKTWVIVRKSVCDDDGVRRYGLSTTGEWIYVPEGERYPDECLLPVVVWNLGPQFLVNDFELSSNANT